MGRETERSEGGRPVFGGSDGPGPRGHGVPTLLAAASLMLVAASLLPSLLYAWLLRDTLLYVVETSEARAKETTYEAAHERALAARSLARA